MHCITMEDLMPQGHFLRKLEAAVDFSFIYDEVREMYCHDNGRPGVDPVVLMKYLLIGYLYGIGSERRIEQEIQVNMAYRWFLGLELDERVPDHSTISQNRRRRFNGQNLYRRLFETILGMCIERGLVDGKIVLTDSTHVKANASRRSEVRVVVEKEATAYMALLDRYETTERARLERLGMPVKKSRAVRKPRVKEQLVSTSDLDAGFLQRPGKPQGMHYLNHQSLDAKHGIVVDVAVTAGNVNDSEPYLERIAYMTETLGLEIDAAGADSAYGTSLISQELEKKGIRLFCPEKETEQFHKTEIERSAFRYEAEEDAFVCPAGKSLRLRNLERGEHNILWVYKSERSDCVRCALYGSCVCDSHDRRIIRMNIFEAAVKRRRERNGSPEHRRVLALRQTWCEGTFAAQKSRHNLRGLFRRGIEAAEDHCLLSAMAINLKRMIKCRG